MTDPQRQLSDLEDVGLLRSYQQTTGRSNDMVANALLAEIERRSLDI